MTGPLVVLGDTLLDRDVEGVVNRLCPDSPVPVLDETVMSTVPAARAWRRSSPPAQGAEVQLVTALADDAAAARLSSLLDRRRSAGHALPLPGSDPGEDPAARPGRVLLRHDRGGPAGPPGEPARRSWS